MSLLHGVKKRFILVVVFVLGLGASGINLLLPGKALAAEAPSIFVQASKRAKAKAIVGYAMTCFSKSNNNYGGDTNDIEMGGLRNGFFTKDGEDIEEVESSSYFNASLFYLNQTSNMEDVDNNDDYDECNEMNIFTIIQALDGLTGKNVLQEIQKDNDSLLNFYLNHVYNVNDGDKDGAKKCFLEEGAYSSNKCKDSNLDVDISGKNSLFYKFLVENYEEAIAGGSRSFHFTNSYTDEEKFWIAYDTMKVFYESSLLDKLGLKKIGPLSDEDVDEYCKPVAYHKNCYRFFNDDKTGWIWYRIHDPEAQDPKQSYLGLNGQLSTGAKVLRLDDGENKVVPDYIGDDQQTQMIIDGFTEYVNYINGMQDEIGDGNKGIAAVGDRYINAVLADRTKTDELNEEGKKQQADKNRDAAFTELINTCADAYTQSMSKYHDELAKDGILLLNTNVPDFAIPQYVKDNQSLYDKIKKSEYFTEKTNNDKIIDFAYSDSEWVDKTYSSDSNAVKRVRQTNIPYKYLWGDKVYNDSEASDIGINGSKTKNHNGDIIETPGKRLELDYKTDGNEAYTGKAIIYCYAEAVSASTQRYLHKKLKTSAGLTLEQDDNFKDIGGLGDVVYDIDGSVGQETYTPIDYDTTTYDPTSTINSNYRADNYEPDTCYSGSGSLGWILCPLIAGASNIGEGLWNQIETYHLKLPANALFGVKQGQTESGVHSAWRSIRDISNIVFVIVFLVIVISQVTGFGITNYGIKKMLPKLIVCIVIVNLSYILCQITVDLSNTIGASITDFLRGIANNIPWEIAGKASGDGGLFSNGFITGILIMGGAGGFFALITSMRTGQNGAGAIIGGLGLFVLGIVIIILVAIITLYVTLMIREAAVVVCIAIAPLAIVCNVLPNTQPLFKKWLNLIKALLVLYPVSAFMVGGGQLAGAILASTGLNTMRLAAGVVQVLPYFFVPTLLRKSLAGLGNIGAKIGSLGKTYGRKASHGATGLIKNSRRYQDMLASSKTNAANRYKTSEQARLERKKNRKERHGGQLSEQDVFRLQAAQEYNESRDAKIDAARRSIEADRAAARRRANSTEIATKDDKLMETYGGAQRDIYTDEMITNPDGSYVIDANRANAYAEGVRLSSQVSTRKEAEEKVAQAAHKQSLYLASARKSDIDLENNLRTARAYSEDMDENGNFVPAGTGTYHASDYVSNQRRTQENKTNSALASGYVRPMETTFAGAHNQAQIRASEEIGKAAESEFREMDKAGPNGLATRMNTMARNIGARDANGNRTFASPGQLETLESSIKVASSRGLEKEAYASYNAALNSFGQAFAEAQASGNTAEMQEIQSKMDSFKRSMQGSSIKAISIHAKQTENMQIDSNMEAADANSYYQGAAFAGYADNKGGNLTIDKDSSAIFQRIGANFSAVHAMEQLGKNDLTQTQITDFAAMAERDLASNNTDISKALSARTLVNLPASTITKIASGTSDVNRNALMAAMNNISAQAMEKLTQEQVRALQTLNPNFGNNTSGNAGSNTGSNAGGNAGNNVGSDWGGSSDNDSGPFAI